MLGERGFHFERASSICSVTGLVPVIAIVNVVPIGDARKGTYEALHLMG